MKPTNIFRKYAYPTLALFCLAFMAVIFWNGKHKTAWPALKPRLGALAEAPEWPATQQEYLQLIHDLERKPQDERLALQLAKMMMQEGRTTGDFNYYNDAALELIERILYKTPANFEALCLKSMVLLSQHRFSEGKAIAEKALQINPYNAFVHGLMVDALVELGEYEQAVQMCDRMVIIRPDIRSYARISYLREIHGDWAGALEAIQQAIAAGMEGREETEWSRIVLAHLFLDNNQLDAAQQQYQTALNKRPNYPFAIAGLAEIAAARGDYPAAVSGYESAAKVMGEAAFYASIAKYHRMAGQGAQAEQYLQTTLRALKADRRESPDKGHNADYELAQILLEADQATQAIPYAEAEYQRRPDNIDVCELLGWIYWKCGRQQEAKKLMAHALRTGAQKPERLLKAGVVFASSGDTQSGQPLIWKAITLKPYMDPSLLEAARPFTQQ